MTDTDLLTIDQVAELTGLSKRTVGEYTRRGVINARRADFYGSVRILVSRSEVTRFLQRRRPVGNPNFGRKRTKVDA